MRASWMSMTLICIGLLAATIAAYWSVLSCSFVSFDDPVYVQSNIIIRSGLSWIGWKYAWTANVCANWHPLTVLSLELDANLWGGPIPAGYHATNLFFHCVNVLLIFVVLTKMTTNVECSACVAALFALHPLHVESVAWISERKDVLSTFFLLLTIWAYLYYAFRPSVMRYLSVAMFMTLGLLAKPMLVTLPILLLLLDFWPLNRIDSNVLPAADSRFPRHPMHLLLLEKFPLLLLSLLDGVITMNAQQAARGYYSLDVRIAQAINAYYWYLQKTFIPTNLMILYMHPERIASWTNLGVAALVLVGISGWVMWQARNKPHLIVGWFWFLISLFPVIGLIQVGMQAYADRYAYIPHIGLFVMLIWELRIWVRRANLSTVTCSVIAALVLATFGWLTHSQVAYWKNGQAMWARVLEITPDNGMAHLSIGDEYALIDDCERAIYHLERGFELTTGRGLSVANSTLSVANRNLGHCLIASDRPDEGEEKLLIALKLDKNNKRAIGELAKLMVKQRRYAEAAQYSAQYEASFAKEGDRIPNGYVAQVNRGMREVQQGNVKQAAVHFEKALRLAPHSATAHSNLANAQMTLGLLDEAKLNLEKSLELNYESAGAHYNLGAILEVQNDTTGAKQHFSEALRINPNDVEARQHLDRLSNL